MLNYSKIFKRLKNGKEIISFYSTKEDSFTVRLSAKDKGFLLHFFIFNGNDVFDERNYEEESVVIYPDFTSLVEALELKFPGIKLVTNED